MALIKFDEQGAVRYSGIEMVFTGKTTMPFSITYPRTYHARLKNVATNWVAAQERKDKKIDAARAPRKF